MPYFYEQQCSVGDRVMISTFQNFQDPAPGFVIHVGGMGCDIAAIVRGGWVLYENAWHIEDSRSRDNSSFTEMMKLRRNQSGIFRLAESEEIIKAFPQRLMAIEGLVNTFAAQQNQERQKLDDRVTALEALMKRFAGEMSDAPKKRGRPPKHPAELASV